MTQSLPVYTAHDVPDLFAALPTLFGFTPTDSIVGVTTYGERRRFGFRLRTDIPSAEAVEAAADLIAGHLHRAKPDGVILLAVTEQTEVAADLVTATMARIDPSVDLIACAWGDGRRYWEPRSGFPSEGVPYESSPHHLSVVTAVAAGQEILPDRQALVDRFAPPEGECFDRLVAVTQGVLDEVVLAVGEDLLETALPEIDRLLAEVLDGEDRLTERDCALLAVWTSSIEVRDELWGRMSHESAREWLRVWTDVSRRAVPPFEPAVLCLASFAAWLCGDGAQALIAAERAQEADPEYSMAHLMLDILQAGLPPTTWTGFRGDRDD